MVNPQFQRARKKFCKLFSFSRQRGPVRQLRACAGGPRANRPRDGLARYHLRQDQRPPIRQEVRRQQAPRTRLLQEKVPQHLQG